MSSPQKRKAEETEEPQTEKRGRGRPRKHPKVEAPPVTPQQTACDQTPGSKRGRGRPRKYPKVETGTPQASALNQTSNDQAPSSKRGRGRPRKHPRVVAQTVSTPGKTDLEKMDVEIPQVSTPKQNDFKKNETEMLCSTPNQTASDQGQSSSIIDLTDQTTPQREAEKECFTASETVGGPVESKTENLVERSFEPQASAPNQTPSSTRGRGRPRKHPSVGVESGTSLISTPNQTASCQAQSSLVNDLSDQKTPQKGALEGFATPEAVGETAASETVEGTPENIVESMDNEPVGNTPVNCSPAPVSAPYITPVPSSKTAAPRTSGRLSKKKHQNWAEILQDGTFAQSTPKTSSKVSNDTSKPGTSSKKQSKSKEPASCDQKQKLATKTPKRADSKAAGGVDKAIKRNLFGGANVETETPGTSNGDLYRAPKSAKKENMFDGGFPNDFWSNMQTFNNFQMAANGAMMMRESDCSSDEEDCNSLVGDLGGKWGDYYIPPKTKYLHFTPRQERYGRGMPRWDEYTLIKTLNLNSLLNFNNKV